jgi:hypothetical protein
VSQASARQRCGLKASARPGCGNLITITQMLGHIATLIYSAPNAMVSRTDVLGNTTTYSAPCSSWIGVRPHLLTS